MDVAETLEQEANCREGEVGSDTPLIALKKSWSCG